jgi:polyisoprenoid-binding protein YceI
MVIDMNSVWSDDEKLTEHLKNEDFFDVGKFPESVFELTGLKPVSEGSYEVSGNLTLTGTTKEHHLPRPAPASRMAKKAPSTPSSTSTARISVSNTPVAPTT